MAGLRGGAVEQRHSISALTPRSTSTPVMHEMGGRQPDLRRTSCEAWCMGSPVSTSGRQSEASTGPFAGPGLQQASRTSSPRQEVGEGGGADWQGAGAARSLQKAEAKEARRQAAQTSLRNMESKVLEGLGTGTFGGSSRSCKQVPIKMMSWGRPG